MKYSNIILSTTPTLKIFVPLEKKNFFVNKNLFKIFKRKYFLELLNFDKWVFKEFFFSNFENFFLLDNLVYSKLFFINFDKNFLNFLSTKNIFLSSENALNDFMYYNHVLKYQEQNKKDLITKFDLSSNFYLNQSKLLSNFDKQFWAWVPKQNSWYYLPEELYVHDEELPFDTNVYLRKTVESMMYPYDPVDLWLASELKSYNNEEPFFFFWPIIQQPMLDYRLLSCLRHRTVFFEELIFWDPFSWHFDENHTFPHLSWWAHTWELKYGFKSIWQNMDFSNESSHLKYLSAILTDIFYNTFDKHYIFIWNYLLGDYIYMDFFRQYDFTTHFQWLKLQLHNPIAHVTSKYTTLVNSYNSLYEKSFYLAVFPDNVLPWSYINSVLDYETAGYTWFFQVGFTFLDWLELLELWRYQAANIVWQGYDNFVDDYDMFWACYIPDHMNSVRTALVIMLYKNFWSIGHFWRLMYDYSGVFGFLDIPGYQQNLVSWILYPMSKLQRLAQFWDEIPVDYWLNLSEWIACNFFGYNVSLEIVNHPRWYVQLWKSDDFLEHVPINIENDIYIETMEQNFLESLTSIYLVKPTFDSMFISDNYKNFAFTNNIYLKYLNEKFLDDAGYFYSSFMRGESINNKNKNFSFGKLWHLNYSSVIQYLHTSWSWFYKLGHPLDFVWWLLPLEQIPKSSEWENIEFYEWFYKIFEFGHSESLIWPAYISRSGEIRFGANAPTYVGVYFNIWLDIILDLFIDANKFLNSKIFFPIHWLSSKNGSTFEIMTTETAYNLCVEIIEILTIWYYPYFVIKIFDEPLKSYFDFIYQIYKSPEFQYLFDLIFKWIMVWNWPLASISYYKYDNFFCSVAAVNYVDCWDWPLPLEFYIPFLYRPQNDMVILDYHPVSSPFDVNFGDYFLEKTMPEKEYMEKIMMIFMLNDLLKTDASLISNPEWYKFLIETSWIISTQYWFEGFDRYINYVLKHNLYVPISSSKLDLNNSLVAYNKIMQDKLILQEQSEYYEMPEVTFLKLWYKKILIEIEKISWINDIWNYFWNYDFHGMSQQKIDDFMYFLWKN